MPIPLRVLILEDNMADVELILRELKRAGFEAAWTRVETEPDFLRELENSPEIILSDFSMPQFDFLRAQELLTQVAPEIPIILVSGTVGEEIAVEAMRRGATDYLLKDRLGRLGSSVKGALETKQLRLEKLRAEEQLRENQRRLQAIFDTEPECVKILSQEGIIQFMNPAGLAMLEAENADDVIGKSVFKFVDEKYHPAFRELNETVMKGGRGILQFEITGLNGTRRWMESYAVPLRSNGHAEILDITRDITERKQAEEQVQHQVRRLNALRTIDVALLSSFDLRVVLDVVLQQIPSQVGVDASAIWLVNLHLRTMELAASRGFRSDSIKHIQLKLNEGHTGRAVVEQRTIHVTESVKELSKSPSLANEGFIEYYGIPLIVKGEVKGVLEVYHRTALNLKGEELEFLETLAGLAAIATENSQLFHNLQRANFELEQRVAERTAELNRTNFELERANRAKDEFLATMSHELRTPLNSILGLSETLLEQRRDPLSERQQKSLQIIESSGRHLLELINDVLDLSKIDAGKLDYYPQVVEVDSLCRSSMAFVKEQATRKSIDLRYEEDQAVSQIFADPRRLKQVLINLLTNAVKFTPDGGHVILQVHADADQDRIQFSIIDNGIGISSEDLKKLFQPFVQVDSSLTREFEGTGLGLALVQKLTDLHGGSVQAESEPGKGSRFTVSIPLRNDRVTQEGTGKSEAQDSTDQQKQGAEELASSPKATILLAEDNVANVLTITEYLESHGYKLVNAQDGMTALEMAEKSDPDLILMDIQMPVLDGLEAIRRLRKLPQFASTPIIAITALAMPGDRERCLEAGANEYMSKPVGLKMLVKTIKRLLGRQDG